MKDNLLIIKRMSDEEVHAVSGGMRLPPYDPNINVRDVTVYGPGPYSGGYITPWDWYRNYRPN